jgi:hypothetical protein
MAEEDQDVAPGTSPGSDAPPESPASDASSVTDVAAAPDDRPIQNVKAEFDRKLTKVERQLAEIAAMLAAQPTQRPAAPEPAAQQAYTDQQLLELANAGNGAALQEYIARQTARSVSQQTQQMQQQQAVSAQLQVLYGRFPVLTDASHPLTQAAMQAKTTLIRMGYPPQSAATDLEAIKLAIVDHPGLAQPSAPATPPSSRGPAAPHAGVDGAAPRRPTPNASAPGRALSQREKDIAARMGIKDPAAAVKRFTERQQAGRSSLSPLVAQIVREEPAS